MIFLRWGHKTFKCDHPDIIGFYVYEDENIVGQKYLTIGLMHRDGSLVSQLHWYKFGVEIE